MTAETPVIVEHGPITTITINRPRVKNALNGEAWRLLGEALNAAADDTEVRVVVLTGAGGDFCAGADLADRSGRPAHPLPNMHRVNKVAQAIHDLPKPTVAKVDGVAVGAGMNLAIGCDLVVATPRARFSEIFARRGLSLDLGGSWLLPKLVGLRQAQRLALLADFVQGEEARELGLVTWVVEPEKIDAFVDDLTGKLLAGPPVALAQNKQLVNAAVDMTLAQALQAEARAQTVNQGGEDPGAAREAFVNKTEPVFTGRWRA
ncbi:MAG: enoyl-CoA hydratase [Streptosporangiales bacterium]|nr:enoyl-CoA hydratase [Streptosporangiales bacterium]